MNEAMNKAAKVSKSSRLMMYVCMLYVWLMYNIHGKQDVKDKTQGFTHQLLNLMSHHKQKDAATSSPQPHFHAPVSYA